MCNLATTPSVGRFCANTVLAAVTAFLLAALGHSPVGAAGAVCDGTVVPGRGFVRAGNTYNVTKGGTTYICVACGSCRPLSSGQGAGGGNFGGTSTRSMVGNAIVGGFMSGLQQDFADAQAERGREAAEAAARAQAERIRRERQEAARRKEFEQQRSETLGALKGFSADSGSGAGGADGLGLKPLTLDSAADRATDSLGLKALPSATADNASTGGSKALRDARCATLRSIAAARETSAEQARVKSERAMQGAGDADCPLPPPHVPMPSSQSVRTPETAARIKATEELIRQLSHNSQALTEANARRQKTVEELERARNEVKALTNQPHDEAQRKAQAALAAAARLEQELAEVEQTIRDIKNKNTQLAGQLGDLERHSPSGEPGVPVSPNAHP